MEKIIIYILLLSSITLDTYSQKIDLSPNKMLKTFPPDFIEKLDVYENMFFDTFKEYLDFFDKTSNSLQLLDSILDEKIDFDQISPNLIYSITYYCGEVIIKEAGGSWCFYELERKNGDYSEKVFFPYIEGIDGKHFDFYGSVEIRFNRFKSKPLSVGINYILGNSFKLEVIPIKDHIFPPLTPKNKF